MFTKLIASGSQSSFLVIIIAWGATLSLYPAVAALVKPVSQVITKLKHG